MILKIGYLLLAMLVVGLGIYNGIIKDGFDLLGHLLGLYSVYFILDLIFCED